MTNSINTNSGALVALQSLNRVNESLGTVQNRVSTGLRVSNAFDDGASFAVAQGLRGDVGGLAAVNERLSVGRGVTSTAVAAGTSISNTLNDIRGVAIRLSDQALSTNERAQYSEQFNSLVNDVSTFIRDASFNGINLLEGGTANIVANLEGSAVTIAGAALDGNNFLSVLQGLTGANIAAADASAFITAGGSFTTLQTLIGTTLNQVAADDRRVNNLLRFNSDLSDAITRGLGSIVDADLARESAQLQALQTRQQLAAQTLGIANQAPQILLGLFR